MSYLSSNTSPISSLSTLNSGTNNLSGPNPNNPSNFAEDNNPFDVTENRDYFKSQDIEIKQLIINV